MLSEFEPFYDMDMLKLGHLFEFVYQNAGKCLYFYREIHELDGKTRDGELASLVQ